MNNIVENVANAIAIADLNASAKSLPNVPMETMVSYVRRATEDGHYLEMARAAIEAMPGAADALRYKSMFDDAVAQHNAQMERAEKAEGFLKAAEEHIERLQTALAFWLPGVAEAIENETGGLAGDHAMLLVGFEGPVPDISWGDQVISWLKQAEADREEARQIVRDIHWMARRYASGRQTYAPSMFNEAINKAVAGGWLTADNVSEPLLADDPIDDAAASERPN